MIVAALLLRPRLLRSLSSHLPLQVIPPALLVAIGLVLYFSVKNLPDYFDALLIGLMILSCLTFICRAWPMAFAGLTGAIIFLSLGAHGLSSHTIFQKRTFFGVLSVRESVLANEQGQDEMYHELFHGTTKHGAQRLPAAVSTTPLTYYSRPGPMGQLFSTFDGSDQNWKIGVVGLGAGALACYAKPSQDWTLYEIDPLVVEIARDTQYFTYLSQCAPKARMVVGDARLSLANEPDGAFDLLVMDAFSSDAVPTHLLTAEAMTLYFKKLKPGGILAFHITNRHLALKKVLSILAEDLRLAALLQEFKPENPAPLVVATDWAVFAKSPEILEPLRVGGLGDWQKMPLYFDMKPWTDDFTNVVGIWK
jgi:SAM-dependent methyltransferase